MFIQNELVILFYIKQKQSNKKQKRLMLAQLCKIITKFTFTNIQLFTIYTLNLIILSQLSITSTRGIINIHLQYLMQKVHQILQKLDKLLLDENPYLEYITYQRPNDYYQRWFNDILEKFKIKYLAARKALNYMKKHFQKCKEIPIHYMKESLKQIDIATGNINCSEGLISLLNQQINMKALLIKKEEEIDQLKKQQNVYKSFLIYASSNISEDLLNKQQRNAYLYFKQNRVNYAFQMSAYFTNILSIRETSLKLMKFIPTVDEIYKLSRIKVHSDKVVTKIQSSLSQSLKLFKQHEQLSFFIKNLTPFVKNKINTTISHISPSLQHSSLSQGLKQLIKAIEKLYPIQQDKTTTNRLTQSSSYCILQGIKYDDLWNYIEDIYKMLKQQKRITTLKQKMQTIRNSITNKSSSYAQMVVEEVQLFKDQINLLVEKCSIYFDKRKQYMMQKKMVFNFEKEDINQLNKIINSCPQSIHANSKLKLQLETKNIQLEQLNMQKSQLLTFSQTISNILQQFAKQANQSELKLLSEGNLQKKAQIFNTFSDNLLQQLTEMRKLKYQFETYKLQTEKKELKIKQNESNSDQITTLNSEKIDFNQIPSKSEIHTQKQLADKMIEQTKAINYAQILQQKQNQLQRLKGQIDFYLTQKIFLSQEIKRANNLNSLREQQMLLIKSKNQQISNINISLKIELEQLKQSKQKINQKSENLQKQLEKNIIKQQQIQQQHSRIYRENLALKESITKLNQQYINQIQKMKFQYQKTIQQQKQSHNQSLQNQQIKFRQQRQKIINSVIINQKKQFQNYFVQKQDEWLNQKQQQLNFLKLQHQDKLINLNQQLAQKDSLISQKQEKNQILNQQLSEKDSLLIKISQTNQQSQEAKNTLQNQLNSLIETLRTQIHNLKLQNKMKEEQMQRLTDQLAILTESIELKQSYIINLTQIKNQNIPEKIELQRPITFTRDQTFVTDLKMNDLQSTEQLLADKTKKIVQKQQLINEMINKNQVLSNQLKTQSQTATKQIQKQQQQIINLKRDYQQKIQTQFTRFQKITEIQNKEIAQIKEEFQVKEIQNIQLHKKEIQTIEKKLFSSENQKRQLCDQLSNYINQINDNKLQSDSLKQQINYHYLQLKGLREQLTQKEEVSYGLTNQIERLTSYLSEKQNYIKQLEFHYQQNEQNKQMLEEKEITIDQLEKKCQQYQQENERIFNQKFNYQQQTQNLFIEKQENLKNIKNQYQMKLDSLKKQYANEKQSIKKQNQKRQKLRQVQFTQKILALQSQKNQISQKYDDLLDEKLATLIVSTQKESLGFGTSFILAESNNQQQKIRNLEDQLQKKQEQHEKVLQLCKKQFTQQIKSLKLKQKQIVKKMQILVNQIKNLKQKLQFETQVKQSLSRQTESLTFQIEMFQKTEIQNNQKIKKLQETLQQMEENIIRVSNSGINNQNQSISPPSAIPSLLPYLVPYTKALFNQDVFLNDQINKEKLVSHLQNYIGSRITRTTLLHKYDKRNKTNFHQYIDQVKGLVIVVKTKNAIVSGFYPEVHRDKQVLNKGGLLVSVTNDQSYRLFTKKPGDQSKTIYRGMIYDTYFAIFGNAQIRVKTGFKTVFSNFGVSNGYFDSRGDRIDRFFNQGQKREIQFQFCEFYKINFERQFKDVELH